jgi:superfamily II DNA/RNA helicase
MKSFIDLGITPPILKALEEMGYSEPTTVQERAIPHILNNEDLIVMSKTGSGKTAVFGVSMLQMIEPGRTEAQCLVLTPTRELAVQVDNDLKNIAAHLEHKTAAVYGQHSMNVEIQALKRGASIVTGTPGRVFDHIRHGNLNTRSIRFLVLDEADRMLDMGFIGQVERIIRTLPKNRITLLFSATIPPEIKRICREYMKNPVTIEIESKTKTVDTIKQVYYRVNHNEKRTQLNRLLLMEQPESCIIFCNTRIAVDQVQRFLTRKGYATRALHGDIAQGIRMRTMNQFKEGIFHILVATDVAARGIHIDDLSLVINYDIPIEKDSYIHRIGRTGRAGNGGKAINLITGDDLMTLYEIEEHIGVLIEEVPLPSEEAFIEQKAAAENWIKANSLKTKPSSPQGNRSNPDDTQRSKQKKASKNYRQAESPRKNNRYSKSAGSGRQEKFNDAGNKKGTSQHVRDKVKPEREGNTNRQDRTGQNQRNKPRSQSQSNQKSFNRYKSDQQTHKCAIKNEPSSAQQRDNTGKKTYQQRTRHLSSSTKPVAFRDVGANAGSAKKGTQSGGSPTISRRMNDQTKNSAPAKKESFIKRLFNRLSGK